MKFLESLADFIGPVVHPREIELNGKSHVFHLREISGADFEEIFSQLQGADFSIAKEKQVEMAKRVMAASICDAEGQLVTTVAEIGKIPRALYRKLRAEVFVLNGLAPSPKDPEHVPADADDADREPPSPKE